MTRLDRIVQFAHLHINPLDAEYLLRVAALADRLVETLADDDPVDHWYYTEWNDLREALGEEA